MKIIPASAWLVPAIAALACAGSAFADPVNVLTGITGVTGNVQIGGGAKNGESYITFDSLTTQANYSAGTSLGGGVTFYIGGNSAWVEDSGNNSSGSSGPYLSGNNSVNFDTGINEGDNTNWVETGPGGGTGYWILSFSSVENYLGILWGSVDDGNVLTFYSGQDGTGTVVATVTGSELLADDANIVDHNTSVNGTAYVNIDTASSFESVEATSSFTTFESDNIAYGDITGVPDGGSTVALLGLALFGLGILNRKLLA